MDATANFWLGDREYHVASPTALQLTTISKIVGTQYTSSHVRAQMAEIGLGEVESIVDVGACIGIMSLCFENFWPNAAILAMEPHPVSFSYLRRNCADSPNIHPVCLGAGYKKETVRLSLPTPSRRPDIPERFLPFNIGMVSRYGDTDGYAADAEIAPLDDIIAGRRVDLIKIDVEGAEKTVIAGAQGILAKHKPFISIELREENLAMGGTSVSEIVSILEALGYRLVGKLFDDMLFRCGHE